MYICRYIPMRKGRTSKLAGQWVQSSSLALLKDRNKSVRVATFPTSQACPWVFQVSEHRCDSCKRIVEVWAIEPASRKRLGSLRKWVEKPLEKDHQSRRVPWLHLRKQLGNLEIKIMYLGISSGPYIYIYIYQSTVSQIGRVSPEVSVCGVWLEILSWKNPELEGFRAGQILYLISTGLLRSLCVRSFQLRAENFSESLLSGHRMNFSFSRWMLLKKRRIKQIWIVPVHLHAGWFIFGLNPSRRFRHACLVLKGGLSEVFPFLRICRWHALPTGWKMEGADWEGEFNDVVSAKKDSKFQDYRIIICC